MGSDTEDFRAKLMSVITDFNFGKWSEENAKLSKLVYDAVNAAFNGSNTTINATTAASADPDVDLSWNEEDNEEEINRPSLKQQIEENLPAVEGFIRKYLIKKQNGDKGKRVNWNLVARDCCVELKILRQDGGVPDGRDIADAYNHIDPNKKSEDLRTRRTRRTMPEEQQFSMDNMEVAGGIDDEDREII